MSSNLAHNPGARRSIEQPTRLLNPMRVVYVLLSLLVVGVLAFATLRPVQVLPRIRLAPGFLLTDAYGGRLTNEDMRGRLTLYNFTRTRCEAPCPQTSQVMQAVQARLGEIETDLPIELVTISLDPEYDTPAALQAYAQKWQADPQRWHLVTGDAERLKWIVGGGFGVYYAFKEDGRFTFDPAFMLVDGAGILRAEYRTASPDVDRILRDLRLVVQEVENSTGAARYAYEAAHLFLCYPRG